MENKMTYMAKIDREPYEKWKNNNGKFNGRLMFEIWIEHLSNAKNFTDFLKTVKPEEKERTMDDVQIYKLRNVDRDQWASVLDFCRENDMFGNDLINILIKRYNDQGYCIDVKIKV